MFGLELVLVSGPFSHSIGIFFGVGGIKSIESCEDILNEYKI